MGMYGANELRVLTEKLIVSQLVKKFPAFMRPEGSLLCPQELATGPCSEAGGIQSTTSHPISLRFFLIFPSHLCLGVQSGLFSSGISTEILYAFHTSPMHATFLALILNLITLIFGKAYTL